MKVFLSGLALLPQATDALALAETPLNVGAIVARGHPMGTPMATAPPDSYVLSPSADSYDHRTPESARLDGGGKEWRLFPGSPPWEVAGDAGPQRVVQNDPTDFCARGDQSGYSILNVTDPTLVPFILPQDHPGRQDAIVIIAPGGGNRFLSWTKEGTQAAKWLNSIGISAAVLKYRVPSNTYETSMKPVVDSERAVRLVRSRASEFGLNASRVGFLGFSAGAFIAGDVGESGRPSYAPVDDADKLSYMPNFLLEVYGYGREQHPGRAPPTFIAVAKNDPCVGPTGAQIYFNKLLETQPEAPHELHIFSDGHHGYGDCTLYVETEEWEPVCAWTLLAQGFMENLFDVKMPLPKHAMKLSDM